MKSSGEYGMQVVTAGQRSGSIDLEPGLSLLGGCVPLDPMISWYEELAGRFLPFNTYLLTGSGSSLLVEGGVPAAFAPLDRQLRDIPPDAHPKRLAVTRNEPDCVANVPALVALLGLETVHSPGLMNTLQFFRSDEAEREEQSFAERTAELQMLDFGVACSPARPGETVPVGGDRRLTVIAAPLRVLPTVWFHDVPSGTLFCSDSFADETAESPHQRVIATVDPHRALVDRFLRSFPLKFDWLARSDLSTVIADLEAVFEGHDIRRLAPNRGLVIEGRTAVRAKLTAVLAALRELAAS